MSKIKHTFLWTIVAVIVVGAVAGMAGTAPSGGPPYALVRVLPYADKDPMSIAPPAIDKDLQAEFRTSMAAMMVERITLRDLLGRDKVRDTEWYRAHSNTAKGMADLRKNLKAIPQQRGDLIRISMTCADPREACVVANELVGMFIRSQGVKRQTNITARLKEIERRRDQIETQLRQAEAALGEVRAVFALIDLDEHAYPHPITVRLMRLQEQGDALALEIKGVEATIEILKSRRQGVEAATDELLVLQSKYAEVHRLAQEAAAKRKDLGSARVQYRMRLRIRDERVKRLDEIKQLIEKLRLLHADPDVAKLQAIQPAALGF